MAMIHQSKCPYCFTKEIYSVSGKIWTCFECKIRIKDGEIIERNIKIDDKLRKALLK